MKKMVSVFLMMLLVVTALASSAWAEGKIQPFYNQTARISASLVINGSTAECMGKIIPNSDATVSSMTMKLQQKKGWKLDNDCIMARKRFKRGDSEPF